MAPVVPELTALSWALLALGALLVGLSKTAVPGSATISVALFAAVLPAKESTGTLLLLLIVGDLFAVWTYRAHADLPTLRRLVPTVVLGVLAGTAFLAVVGDEGVRRTIGVIILALIGLTLVRKRLAGRRGARDQPSGRAAPAGPSAPAPAAVPPPGPGRRTRLERAVYGVLGGFTTMVANAGGPVMSLYFLSARFSMRQFLGTAAWFFFAVNLVKTPFSIGLGLIDTATLRLDVLLVPAVVAGALLGRVLVRHIDQALFERLVVVLTVASGAYLVIA